MARVPRLAFWACQMSCFSPFLRQLGWEACQLRYVAQRSPLPSPKLWATCNLQQPSSWNDLERLLRLGTFLPLASSKLCLARALPPRTTQRCALC